MGQFKRPKKGNIILMGAGHSLILGHLPDKVGEDYDNLNFSFNSQSNFGLFGGDPNHNFYPGLTAEDYTPSDDDFIKPVYRMLSEVVVNKQWNPVDFSQGGVLKNSMALLKGQTVNTNHATDVENAIGAVVDTFWQNSYTADGLKIPAGINAVLKIDAKANPKIARGILMDPPSIHSNSVNVRFAWEKSHPNEDDNWFWRNLGKIGPDNKLVRRVVVYINSYGETSLVSHGADPYAQKIDSKGKIINPVYANSQSFKADSGNNIDYYFIDFKSTQSFSKKDDTIIYNNISDESYSANDSINNNNGNMYTLETFLAALIAVSYTEQERTAENFGPSEDEVIARLKEIATKVTTLESSNTSLQEQLDTVNNEKTQLETKVEDLEQSASYGKTALQDLRDLVLADYNKLNPGESKDETMVQLISTSTVVQLKALQRTYQVQLEKEFPLSCKQCGSQEVGRYSAEPDTTESSLKTPTIRTPDEILDELRDSKLS